jgi:hypothetical protein
MKEPAIENTANELKNPLPDKIPNIVWDDLLSSENKKNFDAIEKKYSINYFHTERRPKKDGYDSDYDVIEIKKDDSKDEKKNWILRYRSDMSIYSRTTSERGKIIIDNPVPEIIPCHIWNNLPNVLKEKIIDTENKYIEKKNLSENLKMIVFAG